MGEQRQQVMEARRQFELLDRLQQKAWHEWRAAGNKEQEDLAAELFLAKSVRRNRLMTAGVLKANSRVASFDVLVDLLQSLRDVFRSRGWLRPSATLPPLREFPARVFTP